MTTKLKAFKLTFAQVPETFGLPAELYLDPDADSMLDTPASLYTEKQKEIVAKSLTVMQKDEDRTCYLDLEGRNTASLKANWMVPTSPGQIELAHGVYPVYTQGNYTGASIGEIVFSLQFFMPMVEVNPHALQAVSEEQKRICFSYMNDDGESAGFSLVALPEGLMDGQYKGWIITTLQNATAAPNEREVHVLATENFVTSQAQTEITVNDFSSFEGQLKAAINNDKVYELIQMIFNIDGSINPEAVHKLNGRIKPNQNIDDRDRKQAELDVLFALARTANFNGEILHEITCEKNKNINFFQAGVYDHELGELLYEGYLQGLLDDLAEHLSKKPSITKTKQEISAYLEKTAENIALLKRLSISAYLQPNKCEIYNDLVQKFLAQAASMIASGFENQSRQYPAVAKIDVKGIETEVNAAFNRMTVQRNSMDKQISELSKPIKPREGFFRRNLGALGFGLLMGVMIGVGVALALTGLLAPIGAAIAGAATALVVGTTTAYLSIRINEKRYALDETAHHEQIKAIKKQYATEQIKIESELQDTIANLPMVQEPDDAATNELERPLENDSLTESTEATYPDPGSCSDDSLSTPGSLTSDNSFSDLEKESEKTAQLTSESTKTAKPRFLNGVQLKKIKPETVANALWLKDKGPESTQESLLEFSIWAKHKGLPFGEKEVLKVISSTYEMKNK